MYADVDCPYCGAELEINHDDGYGYQEDVIHEQECSKCDMMFAYTTSISFYYEAYKADCLNGAKHKVKKAVAFPAYMPPRYRCVDCDFETTITDDNKEKVLEKCEIIT